MPQSRDTRDTTSGSTPVVIPDETFSPIDAQQVERFRNIIRSAIGLNPAFIERFEEVIKEEVRAAREGADNAEARGPNERPDRALKGKDVKAETMSDTESLRTLAPAPAKPKGDVAKAAKGPSS